MLFNTVDFALFLPLVFVFYWLLKSKKIKEQNLFLLLASYVFYSWWDWRFLALIFLSTIVDFCVGLGLEKYKKRRDRKTLLSVTIVVNLGLLGVFKYYNFFIESFVNAFSFFGLEIGHQALNIVLPVGISFYTFQTLSYSIDVYKKKIGVCKDFVVFAAFVSFFPQLVAGPIERAKHLLPQFYTARSFSFNQTVDGLRQILWGLFKKVLIADQAAPVVNHIFSNSAEMSGSALLLGAVFFTFQIYGDFSGYSDIAIGTARLFGFDLKQNFAFPYFSRDIAEFWRRWHISLSSWFRDYLYIPLGGSRGRLMKKIRNVLIVFLVSGFWHGANWTFLFWGGLHALFFIPLLVAKKNRTNIYVVAYENKLPKLKDVSAMFNTFLLATFAWIFFRAETVSHALEYINGIFSNAFFGLPLELSTKTIVVTLLMIFFMIVIEWRGRREQHALECQLNLIHKNIRWVFYLLLSVFIINGMMNTSPQEFIYFQF